MKSFSVGQSVGKHVTVEVKAELDEKGKADITLYVRYNKGDGFNSVIESMTFKEFDEFRDMLMKLDIALEAEGVGVPK